MNACANGFELDTQSYLSRHDIVFHSPFVGGYEGFPLGNGDLGGMLWTTESGLTVQVNKNDTWDDTPADSGMVLRSCGRVTIDFGAPCFNWCFLEQFEARLSLAHAQSRVTAKTPFLNVSVNASVQANSNVLILDCDVAGCSDLADSGSQIRIGLERWGSRAFPSWYAGIDPDARKGLGAAQAGCDGGLYLTETFGTLDVAVACRVIDEASNPGVVNRHRVEAVIPAQPVQKFRVAVAVVTSNESQDPLADAIGLLDEYENTGIDQLREEHDTWWKRFWQKSFVHIGDDYLENLYYLQMYLMACASRGKYPAIFNAATFTWNRDVRQWVTPHHWNTQQAYWSLCAANHAELMRPYLDTYWRLLPDAQAYAKKRGCDGAILFNESHDFAGGMPGWDAPDRIHSFTQAAQIAALFWQYYQYTCDGQFLVDRAYPFMTRAAAFYLHYLTWDDEHKCYDVFPAQPYECPQGDRFKNTIADLATIRTSFRACIQASEILDVDSDKRAQWEDVLDRLAEYPLIEMPGVGEVTAVACDEGGNPVRFSSDGFEPGGDAELDDDDEYTFCRNTAPVFPAGDIGIADKGTRLYDALARRAKLHPRNKLAISPIAVVKARLGMAEETRADLMMSIRQLQHFPQGLFFNLDHWHTLSRYADKLPDAVVQCQRDYVYDQRTCYPNVTMGDEQRDTPAAPFVQCGLEPSAILAVTVNEMLLQSHDGVIRVFPATPLEWSSGFTLRAVGGFLISSYKQKDADAQFIHIHSQLGNECRLVNPWKDRGVQIRQADNGQTCMVNTTDNDVLGFATQSGCSYLVCPEDSDPDAIRYPQFESITNNAPKHFHEAVLGKPRGF